MEILNLSDFITTKAQAVDFSDRLSKISDNIYKTDFNLEQSLQEEFGSEKKDKLMSLLRNNDVPVGTNTALEDFFIKIEETVKDLPIVNLTLAIEPDEAYLKKIADWFVINLNKQVLIEVEVDEGIIGGAMIGFEGKQFNASVKPYFEKTYKAPASERPNEKANK
jgi:hypothetical protein